MYNTSELAGAAAALGAFYIVYFALIILIIIGTWKVFVKAGKPGWGSIVPFYSQYLMFDMAMGNGWLFLLCLVPVVNIVILIMCNIKLAHAFGKGTGFGVCLYLFGFVCLPILGFGSAKYEGPQ